FRRDVAKYEAAVNRAVKVPITQAQFDALVSFHYNTGAIGRASLVKRLNAGDVAGAAAGFMAWKKPPEIIPRRKAEQELFAKGVYPGGQVTVWQVSNSGRVIWKPARRLSKDQVLALLDGPVAEPHKPAAPPTSPTQRAKPAAPPSPAKEAGKALAGGAAGALAVLVAYAGDAWAKFVAFCDFITFWN
ncbi:MAG: lysozyme, partial [Paracoccus sp.]|nr:lysozyme [Paracoccus sp. (in: a-proteobacteria)]